MISQNIRTCDLCGGDNFTHLNTKEAWSISKRVEVEGTPFHDTDVYCNSCGLVQKSPMMDKESLHKFYADCYIPMYKPLNIDQISRESLVDEMLNSIYRLDWLKSLGYDLHGKKVLDVGSGMGMFSAYMASLGATVHSLDPIERNSKISQVMFGRNTIVGTLDTYTEGDYDLITICDTLEHVYSPTDTMTTIRGLLNKTGQVFIEVPDAFYPYTQIPIDAFLSSAHTYTFSQNTLGSLLSKTGFNVGHLKHAGHNSCILSLANQTDNEQFLYGKDNMGDLAQLYKDHTNMKAEANDGAHKIITKYPMFSNYLSILATSSGLPPKEIIELLSTWKENQPECINTSYSDSRYITGMAYLESGDIVKAKECLTEAMSLYHNPLEYNLTNEILTHGLLTPLNFQRYLWYHCGIALAHLQ